jgi:hypothetical protein
MNAEICGQQTIGPALYFFRIDGFHYQPYKLGHMLPFRKLRTHLVIGQQMSQRRDRPIAVERIAHVGHGQKQDALFAQYAEKVQEGAEWILAVFEEMIGDQEILGRIRNPCQPLPVIHDIDPDQLVIGKVGVLPVEFFSWQAIEIGNVGPMGDSQRPVQGANLDSSAA